MFSVILFLLYLKTIELINFENLPAGQVSCYSNEFINKQTSILEKIQVSGSGSGKK